MNVFMVFFMVSLLSSVKCDIISHVDLTRKLKESGVTDWFIPLIVCLAAGQSGLDSNTVEAVEKNGSNQIRYGLFALPEDVLGTEFCNLTKEQATDNNVTDDLGCLMKMLRNSDKTMEILQELSIENYFHWWSEFQAGENVATKVQVTMSSDKATTTPMTTTPTPMTTTTTTSPPGSTNSLRAMRSQIDGFLNIEGLDMVLLLVVLSVTVIIFIMNCLICRRVKAKSFCALCKSRVDIGLQNLDSGYPFEANSTSNVFIPPTYENYSCIPTSNC